MNQIVVTGIDLVKLTQQAYALSRPQGMGFLHFTEGELSQADAQKLVDRSSGQSRIALSLDYVVGRAVKLTVFKDKIGLFMDTRWFDHTDEDLRKLLKACDVPEVEIAKVGT
jgi:hypothetical protein